MSFNRHDLCQSRQPLLLPQLRCLVRGAVLLVASCLLALAGAAPATADPLLPEPDWTVRTTFIAEDGADVPLRIGRGDSVGRQGFGVRHIIEGHDEVPDERDIGAVLGRSNALCKYTQADGKSRCALQIGDRAIIVVYTERIDGAAPDGRPVGIITAYYTPRGCPC